MFNKNKVDEIRQKLKGEPEKIEKKAEIILSKPEQVICEKYNISVDKLHEFEPTELYFTDQYISIINQQLHNLLSKTCEYCQTLPIEHDHTNCKYNIVHQKVFWIEGFDFVLLYWTTGLLDHIHVVDKINYQLHINEILQ